MADFATDEEAEDSATVEGEQLPSPRANTSAHKRRKHIKLATVQDVKSELARLYRSARGGEIETQDATRLAYLLNLLAKIMETSDLEARITALEANTAREA